MIREVYQFRYYGEGSDKNYHPSMKDKEDYTKINANDLQSGVAFNEYMPVRQLGIQSIPGTKFYLNDSVSPIVIGSTGIYEIELNSLVEIKKLSFDPESIWAVQKSPTFFIIVDILCEKENEGGNI